MKRFCLLLFVFLTWPLFPVCAESAPRERIRERVNAQSPAARQDAHETLDIAGLSVAVWRPDPALSSLRPLIVFSHGFMGCKDQSEFLMEALAARGYFVAAPDHEDSSCVSKRQKPAERFRKGNSWTEETYKNRAEDMRRLLDALKQDKRFSLYIDWNRIGLAGHSLGGYTVLGLGGAWPGWKLPEAKAVLALSPYCSPFIKNGDIENMNVPVMYQSGTRDFGIAPWIRQKGGIFAQTAAPANYIEFDGAGHFAWTDRAAGSAFHADIIAYSLWFFDRNLMNSEAPFPAPGEGVALSLSK